MNRHEQLRHYILNNQKCNPTGGIHYPPIKLAADFGLPVDHVERFGFRFRLPFGKGRGLAMDGATRLLQILLQPLDAPL